MTAMTELSFARQFLTALDSRPIKLAGDHVADARNFPAQGAYTIPKYPSQPTKRKRQALASSPGATKSTSILSISLKNVKAPASSIITEKDLTTSIYDLKAEYAQSSGATIDKIKLLYSKKPIPDSKTLKDLLGDSAETTKNVEFSVMVMGGVPAAASPQVEVPEVEMATAPVAQGTSGAAVLQEETFWNDLNGFLQQRVRDEAEAARLSSLFKEAWQKGGV